MLTIDKVKKLLPSSLRRRVIAPVLNEIGAFMIDSGTWLLGQRDPSMPPTRLHFVGNGDFKAVGYEFLRYFIEFGRLAPNHAVLDVGCGIGRMALPLTSYLSSGRYLGFDIVPRGISWCQQNITARFPSFRFELADIYNEAYNPAGRLKAAEYRFPAEDNGFDFAFATSVFTHLLVEDVRHYLSELGRVLKPGGRVLGTWFVLTPDAQARIAADPKALQLLHNMDDKGEVRVYDKAIPESAIGFSEALIRQLHQEAGLVVETPIRFGSWSGRTDHVSYQDIVVARKA